MTLHGYQKCPSGHSATLMVSCPNFHSQFLYLLSKAKKSSLGASIPEVGTQTKPAIEQQDARLVSLVFLFFVKKRRCTR